MYPQKVIVWTRKDGGMSVTISSGTVLVPADKTSDQLQRDDFTNINLDALITPPEGMRLALPREIDEAHVDLTVLHDETKHYVVPATKTILAPADFVIHQQAFTLPEGKRRATMHEIAARDIPADQIMPGTQPHEVFRSDLPDAHLKRDGRDFRNAWQHDHTGNCSVHMGKARELHKNNLRQRRTEHLERLDKDYMRADEAGDNQKKQQIKAKKDKLRDITAHPQIDAAQTTAELRLAAVSVFDDVI